MLESIEQSMVRAIRRHNFRLAIDTEWGQDWDDWMAARPSYSGPGHMLGYDPTLHNEGKGLITSDGSVWTWPTHMMRPQHLEYNYKAQRQGLGTSDPFHITNGRVWVYGPGRTLSPQTRNAITAADPRLGFADDQQQAQNIQQAPPGFGHGRNVLDILNRQ